MSSLRLYISLAILDTDTPFCLRRSEMSSLRLYISLAILDNKTMGWIWQTITGAVQGITELLPISSSGHLLLLSLLSGDKLKITEIAIVHLGTLAAILIVLRKRLKLYLNFDFALIIFISILPAGIIGFLFNDIIDKKFGTKPAIIASLIIWGVALIAADHYSKGRNYNTKELVNITPIQALLIGLGQMIALIPGTSRSGVTTIAGMGVGLSPKAALEFSFLSGIPLMFASGVFGLVKNAPAGGISNLILPTVVAFVFGVFSAWVLMKYIKKRILTACGVYRVLLGFILSII